MRSRRARLNALPHFCPRMCCLRPPGRGTAIAMHHQPMRDPKEGAKRLAAVAVVRSHSRQIAAYVRAFVRVECGDQEKI
jgi:hypothetical protein